MRARISPAQITAAVNCLKQGDLVAMPTETVYGLAADASNPTAVQKIFAVKGRPTHHPLIVHLADLDQLTLWAREIPDAAWQLAQQFWPGPMTLILKKQAQVLTAVTGGQDTVGVRIPSHPIAQHLLRAFGGGLAAPSANRFGYISPTSAQHVRSDLGDKVAMILEGGPCSLGIESTIIDCRSDNISMLRPGTITATDMLATLGIRCAVPAPHALSIPQVSGALPSHYAPRTTTHLFSAEKIDAYLQMRAPAVKNIIILSTRKPTVQAVRIYEARIPYHRPAALEDAAVHWMIMPADPEGYAHHLYEQLHIADQLCGAEIWIEMVPNTEAWRGIMDRITKASARM